MDRHAIRDVINNLTYLKEIPTCHIAVFPRTLMFVNCKDKPFTALGFTIQHLRAA